jgi:hypothetical protein
MNLTVEVAVSTPTGWLALEDEANGLEIGAESFASKTLTPKTRKIGDDRVDFEGTLTIAMARGMVTEPIQVIITGETHDDYDTKEQQVIAAFQQLSFQVTRQIGNSKQTWDCFCSENIQITTEQPHMFATMGVVTIDVPHLPSITQELVP